MCVHIHVPWNLIHPLLVDLPGSKFVLLEK